VLPCIACLSSTERGRDGLPHQHISAAFLICPHACLPASPHRAMPVRPCLRLRRSLSTPQTPAATSTRPMRRGTPHGARSYRCCCSRAAAPDGGWRTAPTAVALSHPPLCAAARFYVCLQVQGADCRGPSGVPVHSEFGQHG
jgi:hypothetical protein